MASCCLEKIQSKVKRHDVYIYAFKVGEILNCSIENDNKYFENAIAVFSSSKKMVGYITEPLALHVFLFSCRSFLMLHSFPAALVRLAAFLCCNYTFFILHFLHIQQFLCCTFFLLHSSPVSYFGCCSFFLLCLLHFFIDHNIDTSKHLEVNIFWKVITFFIIKSSCLEVFCKKLFLKILQNSLEKHCVGVSFLIKLQDWGLQRYWKNRLRQKCFPVNFAEVFFGACFCIIHAYDFHKKMNRTKYLAELNAKDVN